MKSKMKLGAWRDVLANAEAKIALGWTVYQQWNCAHCGTKQTMPDANYFYKLGDCEECGKRTNIEADGHNFMALGSTRGPEQ